MILRGSRREAHGSPAARLLGDDSGFGHRAAVRAARLATAGATLGAALSRRGWRALEVPPPVPIPLPRRTICEAPTLTLRVPRSVWDTRYAAIAHPERQ